ncbi:MAG: methyltransferase domain-containing protein [Phycisphaeraceae bacterium]|nr:methyltransferase domain-containing protein [Phycisphaeraceae bacterium]
MSLDQGRLEELLHKIVGDVGAAMSAALVHIGDRLGLYKALASGPRTSAQLAGATGLSERMLREWLLNQASGGYIEYDDATGAYSMTPEQVAAFGDENSPALMLGAFDIIESVHRDVPTIAEAFRHGRGVPWGAHDGCLFCGTERFFAAGYRANLISAWIPSLEGVEPRLRAGARVADLGCGHGASTLLLARAFPQSTFVGLDFHGPSIECARGRAAGEGLRNVSFEIADSVTFPAPKEGYDLVACFDCLHDMGDPEGCAKRVHQTLAPGGVWMVVEPAAADDVRGNLNPVGRVFSAASTMICVPASMAFGGPALGACAGEKVIRKIIQAGGFSKCRVAARTPFNFVYEARA